MTVRNILDLRSFAIALALVCACASIAVLADTGLPDGVVATVDGQPVPRSMLDALAKARHVDEPVPALERTRLLDDLVMTELLNQRAHASGLAARADAQAELELAYKTLLGERLMQQLASEVSVSEEALQARYRDALPELSLKASHILLADEASARQVIAQIDAGASFAALARKLSADEYTRDKGGRLEPVESSNLEPAFVEAARSLKPGSITRLPVRTTHGWHVIQLHEMRSLGKPPFDAMKPALRAQLVNEQVQAQVAQWRKEATLTLLQAP
jgi:peptidyl-prolyl cis-trans isomerase C